MVWTYTFETFNINTVSSDFTPCIMAIKKGNINALRTLLESGADPNKEYRKRDNDIHGCDGYRIISYPIIFAIIEGNLEMVKLLVSFGANLSVFLEESKWNSYEKTINKRSVLSCAMDYKHEEICDFLVEKGMKDNNTLEEINLYEESFGGKHRRISSSI